MSESTECDRLAHRQREEDEAVVREQERAAVVQMHRLCPPHHVLHHLEHHFLAWLWEVAPTFSA